MNSTIVMYHYVRPSISNNGIRGITPEFFRQQIRLLKKNFKIISFSEMLSSSNAEQTCVLSFDDGIKDAVDYALPILKEEGVKAIFFLPMSIINQKTIINVQKRHLLLAKIGTDKMIMELNNELPNIFKIKADKIFQADYLDDLLTSSMKWMLDFGDVSIMDAALSTVFKNNFNNEEEIFDELYLSNSDILKLLDSGMEVGCHGYHHTQLGIMSGEEQYIELQLASRAIKKIQKKAPLYLSYPLGSYNPITLRVAHELGFTAGVTIKKHKNLEDVPLLELGRYDCIDPQLPQP